MYSVCFHLKHCLIVLGPKDKEGSPQAFTLLSEPVEASDLSTCVSELHNGEAFEFSMS